ncbi:MAG: alpha/beta hydrolase [Actinobacteria bacterium]|nr:MAG: alpha/beta hydrolase [Actinomycetota bacterium]
MTKPTHRTVRTNGIDMHVAEQGEGPAVVLCHGFPELWYSWRHQLPALAEAGYRAIAPDQRGYGGTDRPSAVDDYDIIHLTDDALGLLDALGEDSAVFVGHDWGAPVVWNLALRAPERVRGVVGMSVPFLPRGPMDPVQALDALFADQFFYILYFQQPGVADQDLGRDTRDTLRRFYAAISAEATAEAFRPLPREGTTLRDWLPEPGALPGWLSQADLDLYVTEFTRTGFTGGLNWYRNLKRNWERTQDLDGRKVEVPALFIAGERDPVIAMFPVAAMNEWVPDLRGTLMIPETGHWTQQERPSEVNAALLRFLSGLG